jgi:tRNA-specific 2-thiouridylase
LAVAHKPDSHDICFVADGDTAGFLRRELGDAPGQIVDQDGSVVGEHDGAYAYTVGQRRGLRIGRPAPDGKPRYVLDISPVERRVTVGPAEALAVDEVVGVEPRWCGATPSGPLECLAQYRAHGSAIPASAELAGDVVTVRFTSPQHGVAPGQAVVLYDGTRVIGSATIDRTVSIGMTTFTTPAGTSRGL